MAALTGNSPAYVPLLKGKRGEFGALQVCGGATRRRILLLIDVPPIPWDFGQDRPSKSLDDHLENIPARLAKCWGNSSRVMVDLYYLEEGHRMKKNHSPTRRSCCEASFTLRVILLRLAKTPPGQCPDGAGAEGP